MWQHGAAVRCGATGDQERRQGSYARLGHHPGSHRSGSWPLRGESAVRGDGGRLFLSNVTDTSARHRLPGTGCTSLRTRRSRRLRSFSTRARLARHVSGVARHVPAWVTNGENRLKNQDLAADFGPGPGTGRNRRTSAMRRRGRSRRALPPAEPVGRFDVRPRRREGAPELGELGHEDPGTPRTRWPRRGRREAEDPRTADARAPTGPRAASAPTRPSS